MNKKGLALFQILFIVLNAISGVYYSPLYMGQWKARVALFGIVTILLVLVTVIAFVVGIVKRRNNILLMIMSGILCVMQFFPMFEAFMLSGIYLRNAIFHIFVLIIGAMCVYLSIKTQKKDVTINAV